MPGLRSIASNNTKHSELGVSLQLETPTRPSIIYNPTAKTHPRHTSIPAQRPSHAHTRRKHRGHVTAQNPDTRARSALSLLEARLDGREGSCDGVRGLGRCYGSGYIVGSRVLLRDEYVVAGAAGKGSVLFLECRLREDCRW